MTFRRPLRRAFQPRLVPTLVALVLMMIGISAGIWQTGRAQQKLTLKVQLEALASQPPLPLTTQAFNVESLRWHTVEAQGVWLPGSTVLLDNRIYQGKPGYQVVTPLQLNDGRVVLVNRGWVAASRERSQLPQVATPTGTVSITGQVRVPLQGAFALGVIASPDGRVWQQLRLEAMAAALKLPLAPCVIFQQSLSDDGFKREWDAPDYGIDTHKGYAFQWFALATLSLIFFLIMSFKVRRDEK